MIKTHGLTHISLAVKDPVRSLKAVVCRVVCCSLGDIHIDSGSVEVVFNVRLIASATFIASTVAFTS